jgi:hypothetical protein
MINVMLMKEMKMMKKTELTMMMMMVMMMTKVEMKPLPLLRKVRRKIPRRESLRSQVMKTKGRSTHLHHRATVAGSASA